MKIIQCKDGSHTLLNEALDETYHSRHSAILESQYVFLEKGLSAFDGFESIHVLEIGFGTGLNAWLTALESQEKIPKIVYTALETHPVPEDVWHHLNYTTVHQVDNGEALFESIHRAEWNKPVELMPQFTLYKQQNSLMDYQGEKESVDLVYFDAFAPSKQPDMWTVDALRPVAEAMKRGGTLVTYCSQGQFRRNLKTVGIEVEKIPGPPGKREMIIGHKV
jgi:tRNA U34 5-methylaminomethyl-2-thiouridine-forming methyltransferase MnmC